MVLSRGEGRESCRNRRGDANDVGCEDEDV